MNRKIRLPIYQIQMIKCCITSKKESGILKRFAEWQIRSEIKQGGVVSSINFNLSKS